MAQNITWPDGAQYSSVPFVELPKTGGGTSRFDDCSVVTAEAVDVSAGKIFVAADGTITQGTGSGGGGGLVLVKTFPTLEIPFADTAFNGWTPSATAKAILATQTVGTFTATDIADYDYFVRQRIYAHLAYVEGTSAAKGMFQFSCGENWNAQTRRSSTATTLNAGNINQNVNESVSTTYLNKYYNGGWVAIYSSAYGIYPSNTAQTLSSTTAASPTVTVKTAVINAKCNTTYFSTAMAGNVDQDASTIKFVIDVYRAESGYMRHTVNHSLADMWLHGLEG